MTTCDPVRRSPELSVLEPLLLHS